MAVALLMVVVGCKSRENDIVVTPPNTHLEVQPEAMTISHEAQRVEIAVVCNDEFDVKEEVFWLAVVDVREGESGVVVINVLANDSAESRCADVTIKSGDEERRVTITQSGVPPISMKVEIGHSDQRMSSPTWGGETVSGTIDWGDGAIEEYSADASHEYADAAPRTAIFTMMGAQSFDIAKIGAMESISIAVE